jgi:7,8-dihydropterin-6-yl-methyl-4-(beta-D-ribofuranosyl)aminobenzene 5'-phosphate synthase
MMRWLLTIIAAWSALAPAAARDRIRALKVTTLSTMLADEGLGEWGYAALVEVDGKRILFDTGAHPDVVMRSAEALKIDLSAVEDVVLSHFHGDHTGGLVTLRAAMRAKNPAALSRVHVAAGIFEEWFDGAGAPRNTLLPIKARYEALGGRFVVHDRAMQLAPGVWFTGPVPRPNAETNWNAGLKLRTSAGPIDDNLPDDAALVFATDHGPVILTGCGHAGIMNLADHARTLTGTIVPHAVIGGLHLFAKPDAALARTAARLKGVRYLHAGHCTGVEATFKLRNLLALDARTAVVAAVGSAFELGKGIAAGAIAGSP